MVAEFGLVMANKMSEMVKLFFSSIPVIFYRYFVGFLLCVSLYLSTSEVQYDYAL